MAVSCATTCARVAKTTGLETLALWPGGQTEHLVEGRALDPRTVRTDRNCSGQQVPQSGQTRDCDNQKPDASATVRPDSTLRRSEKIRKTRRPAKSRKRKVQNSFAISTVRRKLPVRGPPQNRACDGQRRGATCDGQTESQLRWSDKSRKPRLVLLAERE